MLTLSPTRVSGRLRLSVFVDADNVPVSQAGAILDLARRHGAPDLVRAYGNVCMVPAWDDTPGFHFIHSGSGKNAADMLICLDAMERAVSEQCEAVLLVSSDQDFTHLAIRLRSYGLMVIGAGEAKTAERFRAACCRFEELEPARAPCAAPSKQRAPSTLDQEIRSVIKSNCQDATGLAISHLSARMSKLFGTRISALPEKTWRGYLASRPDLFDLDPKGPNAKVRYNPAGFATQRA